MTQVPQGLDDAQAARLLAKHGPNALPKAVGRGLIGVVLGTLHEPMFLLMLGASGLYLFLGDLAEGGFLLLAAFATVALVVVQDVRSERDLNALRVLGEPTVRVIRSGTERTIPMSQLVPGDLALVGEGRRLPADGALVQGEILTVDESALTGESAPMVKTPGPAGDPGGFDPSGSASASDGRDSRLFAGTMVLSGQGSALIVRTGPETALGQIGASLSVIETGQTPLQKVAARLVGFIGLCALAFSALVAVAYGLLRGDWVEAALAGITIGISLVPEEFPMVLAIFMALGAWRLAQHRVLVRRPAVIESLGAATLLCVDKTGTLTENRMVVARWWADEQSGRPEDENLPAAARAVLDAGIAASAQRPTDPMDRALRQWADGETDEGRLEQTWPLKVGRLAVVQLWRHGDKRWTAAAKGAPEAILTLCRLPKVEHDRLAAVVEQLAAEGLRVLAVASLTGQGGAFAEPDEATFTFLGLVGFLDPVRQEVPAALEEARKAGIAVVMITGDHPATALAIARQAGIDVEAGVLSGTDLGSLTHAALAERIGRVRVFARVSPAQKLALVQAFQGQGQWVAMTGDGINDAPALQAADIGIAMGLRGTDVAREAADLVLLDDRFASIVGGVRLGRRIFGNLRKALTYIVAVHIPIAGLALIPILFGAPPLLYPMHIVMLEMVIDPLCSLVFEASPGDRDAMKHPPRRLNAVLFGGQQIAVAVVQGVVILGAVLGLYLWGLGRWTPAEARAAAFAALILANLSLALVESLSNGVGLLDRSRALFWMIGSAALAVIVLALWIPWLADLFRFSPPPPVALGLALLTGLLSGSWYVVVQQVAAARGRRRSALSTQPC
jgi:Ca2+-transporting ATPase